MNFESRIKLINQAIWESIVARPDNEIISANNWFQINTPDRPAAHMNGVYRCERSDLSGDEIQRLVSEVIDYYRARKSNFRWKISSETRPQGLGKVLTQKGMILKDLLFGFCVVPSEMNFLQPSGNIEVFPLTLERLEDWLVIQSAGWNISLEGIQYLRKHRTETLHHSVDKSCVIAYWNDKPAGAASFQIQTGYAFMEGAVVLPEFRGKGLYRALIKARFNELKSQSLPAVFHCVSTTSAPVCIKLGFQKLCEIESYELPPTDGLPV